MAAPSTPSADLCDAQQKHGNRVWACLQNGLSATQAAMAQQDTESIWTAAGTVVNSLKRLGEVLSLELSRRERDSTRATLIS